MLFGCVQLLYSYLTPRPAALVAERLARKHHMDGPCSKQTCDHCKFAHSVRCDFLMPLTPSGKCLAVVYSYLAPRPAALVAELSTRKGVKLYSKGSEETSHMRCVLDLVMHLASTVDMCEGEASMVPNLFAVCLQRVCKVFGWLVG